MKWIVIIICLYTSTLQAQHQETVTRNKAEYSPHHKGIVALILGHSFLSAGEHVEGGKKAISVPTWGLDFGYRVSRKFSVVWASEIHIQEYFVSNENVGTIKREFPIVTALELGYMVTDYFAIVAGPGIEIERNQNFFIFRIGIEREFLFNNDWAFIPSIFYETKEGQFGALTIGFGVARGVF